MLNRTILLLNVGVLLVSFFLAWSSTDSQIGLLTASVESGRSVRRTVIRGDATSAAELRVIQAAGNVVPAAQQDHWTVEHWRALRTAVRAYYATVRNRMNDLSGEIAAGSTLRNSYAAIGKEARTEVERVLGAVFTDVGIVRRLATEVVRQCR